MVKIILCTTLAGLLLALAGCESGAKKITRLGAEASAQSAIGGVPQPDGQALFRQYCVLCHGADGKLGLNGAKDLTQSALTLDERILIITKGKNLMTPFGEMLTPEEIRAVAAYTTTLK